MSVIIFLIELVIAVCTIMYLASSPVLFALLYGAVLIFCLFLFIYTFGTKNKTDKIVFILSGILLAVLIYLPFRL